MFTVVSTIQRYKICKQFTTDVLKRDKGAYVVSTIQRYKICKQFTTYPVILIIKHLLFLLFKDTRFVSNSQPAGVRPNKIIKLFLLFKDTRFVSNSQHNALDGGRSACCFYYSKIQDL